MCRQWKHISRVKWMPRSWNVTGTPSRLRNNCFQWTVTKQGLEPSSQPQAEWALFTKVNEVHKIKDALKSIVPPQKVPFPWEKEIFGKLQGTKCKHRTSETNIDRQLVPSPKASRFPKSCTYHTLPLLNKVVSLSSENKRPRSECAWLNIFPKSTRERRSESPHGNPGSKVRGRAVEPNG